METSSTAIRSRVAAGESVKGLVPEAIRVAVECEPSYGAPEALSQEFFSARKSELVERVSSKRFEHVMGVVEACGKLAETYGVDVRKARLAGLLHDWDKGYDDAGIRARAEELGCAGELGVWLVENMPQVLHAHTAARALARDFPCIPADVIRAIDRHTTAAVDMTPLEMVLYVADAIEEGRRFGRIDQLRAAVGTVCLEELFFLTYEYWVLLLFERRKQLHPDTIAIWNALVARRAAGKETHDR
ncbi:MAG: bis(5'-nucleosyl)-tetraphosphatase (symmetrical) YqeK [Eggerthellaceae bacterium]|nr:bis(5'-nucleosyl)-tetraphosphatase (symmetrical) YqeK [Eggerthellaceae bacterium]